MIIENEILELRGKEWNDNRLYTEFPGFIFKKAIRGVDLSNSQISDSGLNFLIDNLSQSKIRYLNLTLSGVTCRKKEQLAWLKKLPHLKTLSLMGVSHPHYSLLNLLENHQCLQKINLREIVSLNTNKLIQQGRISSHFDVLNTAMEYTAASHIKLIEEEFFEILLAVAQGYKDKGNIFHLLPYESITLILMLTFNSLHELHQMTHFIRSRKFVGHTIDLVFSNIELKDIKAWKKSEEIYDPATKSSKKTLFFKTRNFHLKEELSNEKSIFSTFKRYLFG